jgi:hypothetical protein
MGNHVTSRYHHCTARHRPRIAVSQVRLCATLLYNAARIHTHRIRTLEWVGHGIHTTTVVYSSVMGSPLAHAMPEQHTPPHHPTENTTMNVRPDCAQATVRMWGRASIRDTTYPRACSPRTLMAAIPLTQGMPPRRRVPRGSTTPGEHPDRGAAHVP